MRSPLTRSILPSRHLSRAFLPFTPHLFLYSFCPTGGSSWPGWKTISFLPLIAFFLCYDIFEKSSKAISISLGLSLRLGIRSRCFSQFGRNISGCSGSELSTRSSSMSLYQFGITKIIDFYLSFPTACFMTFFLSSTIIQSQRLGGVLIQVFASRA